MNRLVLPLILLLAACTAPIENSRIQTPTLAIQPPPLVQPRGGEADALFKACRAEATRVVVFRERGQTMRNDEIASSPGGFSNNTAMSTFRMPLDQASAEAERDRLTRDCMAGAQGGAGPAVPPAGTR